MSTLENQPTEMLEMIFRHLSHQELIETTKVSPRFNKVISKCSRLMNIVTITFKPGKESLKVPLKNNRRYKNLKIQNVRECGPELKKLFRTVSKTLTWVRLESCIFRMSDLHWGLTMVSSRIQQFAVVNTRVKQAREMRKIEMPNLEYLEFSKMPDGTSVKQLISCVSTQNLRRLIFDKFGDNLNRALAEDIAILMDLITPQKNLIKVTLPRTVTESAILYWMNEKPLEAKLRTLFLYYPLSHEDSAQQSHPCRTKFLQSQRSSLERLFFAFARFKGDELQDLLSLQLKDLLFVFCPLEWNSQREIKNTSIKKLAFAYKYECSDSNLEAIKSMLSSCVELRDLTIAFGKYERRLQPVLDAISKSLKITTLSVFNIGCLNATTFPSVTRLIIIDDDRDEILRLVTANRQVSSLNLVQSLECDIKFKLSIQTVVPNAHIQYNA